MINSRRVNWAYRTWVLKPEGKNSLESPRHRWVIIIKLILKALDVTMWTGFV
jgi:hypothetical protein